MRSGHCFDLIEQNDKDLRRRCTTDGYSRRRTRNSLFIVRVEGLDPGWCGIYRDGWGWVHVCPERIHNIEMWYRTYTGVERWHAVQVFFEHHKDDRQVMYACIYIAGGESVVLGR